MQKSHKSWGLGSFSVAVMKCFAGAWCEGSWHQGRVSEMTKHLMLTRTDPENCLWTSVNFCELWISRFLTSKCQTSKCQKSKCQPSKLQISRFQRLSVDLSLIKYDQIIQFISQVATNIAKVMHGFVWQMGFPYSIHWFSTCSMIPWPYSWVGSRMEKMA